MGVVCPNLKQEESMAVVPKSDLKVEDEVFDSSDLKVEEEEMDVVAEVENQGVKEDSPAIKKFSWRIEGFSTITEKLYSDVFCTSEGYRWRVLVFPRGNNINNYGKSLSLFLDTADDGRGRSARFRFSVVDQISGKHTVCMDAENHFMGADYGFTRFMSLCDLHDAEKGFLVEDTCVIEAEVAVSKVVDYRNYDSKKETGYVGLKNQGATCYMNSLLQTLYHIPCFRKAVYRMSTNVNEGIPLALLTLFYKLQYGGNSAETNALTKSFGWKTSDGFQQHDVQELNRVLCERLEDKMKGTVVEGKIQELFGGHHMNYIECIDVDYKSTRKESYYDIQLDVKGCRDVYASFDKYVEVERMEGDNKYHAEQHGLQDAKKGVTFVDFPPVLQLQLKRFEYDCTEEAMVKINDKYEFPLTLDLDRDNGKYLSPDSVKGVRNLYTLHSVLVHRGGVNRGHYYAFIRPTLSNQWFKFDDERVTKEEEKMAVEENYGGEDDFKFTRDASAYMLVYVRASDKDKIICSVDEKDIDDDLRMRLKEEQEEQERREKERAEAHLYTTIKVARDQDLAEQIGSDIYFDLFDHEKVTSFRVKKQLPFKIFQEEVAEKFGVRVEAQLFWLWEKTWGEGYHTCRQLSPLEKQLPIVALKKQMLFLQVEPDLCLLPNSLPEKTVEDILLFCKLYDPKTEQVRYVGRLFVKDSGKPTEVLSKLNKMAGFADDVEIDLYVESRSERGVISCERIDKNKSFCELEDGSIIWLQRSSIADKTGEEFQHPDVPSFFEYLLNLLDVHFRYLDKPNVDEFCLRMSKTFSYDVVVEEVARHLGVEDPTKIRLRSPSNYYQQPDSPPIEYRSPGQLSDMLRSYNTLYYEILDIPLPELEKLITLDVIFHPYNRIGEHDEIHSIRVPKESTVCDVLNELKTKVELSHPNAELRLLGMHGHRIREVYSSTENIDSIDVNRCDFRADEIPEEEKHIGPNDHLIRAYHITKHGYSGESFMLVLHEGETLLEVKRRIQNKLNVEDEKFSKWKFACCLFHTSHDLEDTDVVSSCFAEVVSDQTSRFFPEMCYGRLPRYGDYYHEHMELLEGQKYSKRGQKYHKKELKYHEIEDLYLGMEHPDDQTVAKPAYAGNQKNKYKCDKSVKICN
ncbi:ubiquitinyl hydrolase 1 [Ranunculus cassubicifolius]